jgi:hydrogenase nickel incorporation protein HypB
MSVEKSTKAARGNVQCENTNIHLLKANDYVAEIIRSKMKETKTLLINVTSSAGSGKTTLMQKTAEKLKDKLNLAVMVGDLETERDADRIRQTGIFCATDCHWRHLSFGGSNGSSDLRSI